MGDIIFLDSYDQREAFELPARAQVVAFDAEEGVRLKNIMMGTANPGHECWVPDATLVRHVFSPMERRKASADWNF